jgi:hypothetical protein
VQGERFMEERRIYDGDMDVLLLLALGDGDTI